MLFPDAIPELDIQLSALMGWGKLYNKATLTTSGSQVTMSQDMPEAHVGESEMGQWDRDLDMSAMNLDGELLLTWFLNKSESCFQRCQQMILCYHKYLATLCLLKTPAWGWITVHQLKAHSWAVIRKGDGDAKWAARQGKGKSKAPSKTKTKKGSRDPSTEPSEMSKTSYKRWNLTGLSNPAVESQILQATA